MNILEKVIESNFPKLCFSQTNHVRNILEYYAADTAKLSRVEYDCDAYYYKNCAVKEDGTGYTVDEALLGDVMSSFWTPYKLALYKKTGWKYYRKIIKTSDKPENWSLSLLLKRMNDPKIKEVNEKFLEFAELCYTKGNFIRLPRSNYKFQVVAKGKIKNYGMNQARFQFCEDRIDYTLYECMSPNGKLADFFDEEKYDEWVVREKLDFIVPKAYSIGFKDMEVSEIYDYVDYAVGLIKKRNSTM